MWRKVYMIYSRWSTKEIEEFLKNRDEMKNSFDLVKVEYKKFEETNRNIVLMKEEFYEKLVGEGYGANGEKAKFLDFKIVPFRVPEEKIKNIKNNTLFLKLSPKLSLSECRRILMERLMVLERFKIFPENSYTLRIPPRSRHLDLHRGIAYINFSEDVDKNSVFCCRLFMNKFRHESNWFFCYFFKDYKEMKEFKEFKKIKENKEKK